MTGLLTLPEAADYLGLAQSTLRNYIHRGELHRANPPASGSGCGVPALYARAELDRFKAEWDAARGATCEICGRPFTRRKKSEKICGDAECVRRRNLALGRKNYGFTATCQRCGEPMPRSGQDGQGHVGGRKWCERCRPIIHLEDNLRRYHRAKPPEARPVLRICVCGKPRRMKRGQWFCSEACKQAAIADCVETLISARDKMRAAERRVFA